MLLWWRLRNSFSKFSNILMMTLHTIHIILYTYRPKTFNMISKQAQTIADDMTIGFIIRRLTDVTDLMLYHNMCKCRCFARLQPHRCYHHDKSVWFICKNVKFERINQICRWFYVILKCIAGVTLICSWQSAALSEKMTIWRSLVLHLNYLCCQNKKCMLLFMWDAWCNDTKLPI